MSTTEWRKLADKYDSAGEGVRVQLVRALRAACTRLDEQANLLGIANEKWGQAVARAEAAEARCRELEQKLNHESYVSDKRALERNKAEARLKVAVAALQHYDQWLSDVAEGDLAREALAKLRGEP